MNHSQALIPQLLRKSNSVSLKEGLAILLASFLLAALAQVAIPLPFTPVPITGQTFGVALLSLLMGRKLAGLTLLTYLAEGAIGLPVFSMGKSGLFFNPTSGYLLGMLCATQVIGYFSDRGVRGSFLKTFLACVMGSLTVFSFGLLGLLFFIPLNKVLIVGLFPFIAGDLVKNLCATSLFCAVNQTLKK